MGEEVTPSELAKLYRQLDLMKAYGNGKDSGAMAVVTYQDRVPKGHVIVWREGRA